MRIKLNHANGTIFYVEMNNVSEISKQDDNYRIMTLYGESIPIKETPEQIEDLERQAILDRDKVIQAEKAQNWSEQIFEQVESSNNDLLDQIKSINTAQNKHIEKLEKRIKALEAKR